MKQNDIITVVNLTIFLSLAFEGKNEPTGKIFLDPTNVLKIKECHVISSYDLLSIACLPKVVLKRFNQYKSGVLFMRQRLTE